MNDIFKDSETLLSEGWKNPLFSIETRLQIADGAVAFERRVNDNLRKRLASFEKHHGQWIVEYPGDVFVVFDPMTDGSDILGAFRRLEDAQYHLEDMVR